MRDALLRLFYATSFLRVLMEGRLVCVLFFFDLFLLEVSCVARGLQLFLLS
jgi:hypothetical protein